MLSDSSLLCRSVADTYIPRLDSPPFLGGYRRRQPMGHLSCSVHQPPWPLPYLPGVILSGLVLAEVGLEPARLGST